MDYRLVMRGFYAFQYTDYYFNGFINTNPSFFLYYSLEGNTFNICHCKEVVPVFHPGVKNMHYVLVVQLCGATGFAQKKLNIAFVRRKRRRKDFYTHILVETGMMSEIDGPHRAGADFFNNLAPRERKSYQRIPLRLRGIVWHTSDLKDYI